MGGVGDSIRTCLRTFSIVSRYSLRLVSAFRLCFGVSLLLEACGLCGGFCELSATDIMRTLGWDMEGV